VPQWERPLDGFDGAAIYWLAWLIIAAQADVSHVAGSIFVIVPSAYQFSRREPNA
jgi:hypothetical protein